MIVQPHGVVDPGRGRRCAVLGSPIEHSLSPTLHAAAYAELGLDWTYSAHDVDESGLEAFLAGLDASWRGLSLTMPLKRAVLPLLDSLGGQGRLAGAVNTVLLGPTVPPGVDRPRRHGENTDVGGSCAALRERWPGPVTRAVVIGGGATAGSAGLALADLGCREVTLMVREPARARETVDTLRRHPTPPRVTVLGLDDAGARAVRAAPPPDVLVSTVPVSAQDERVLAVARDASVVFDVVYDPWPTPLATSSEAAGCVLVSGLDLLVHQAVLQLQLMTGTDRSPVATMRSAGERVLAARS